MVILRPEWVMYFREGPIEAATAAFDEHSSSGAVSGGGRPTKPGALEMIITLILSTSLVAKNASRLWSMIPA